MREKWYMICEPMSAEEQRKMTQALRERVRVLQLQVEELEDELLEEREPC